ncbi:uncharacterized protein LOC106167111 [Lingula anatina]|uniref:Uncharacterized protein LOC106167111 n=1 Tax=Lingula anatina TaxID=7574 RepID=A0A1S3ITK7_LINAN|nr:uncharacterized protein LOC106167111 [Lingula anatina]|eukprot:XP_013401266.1 uncharacterized protein LOC106167111 [Lingula anatina]
MPVQPILTDSGHFYNLQCKPSPQPRQQLLSQSHNPAETSFSHELVLRTQQHKARNTRQQSYVSPIPSHLTRDELLEYQSQLISTNPLQFSRSKPGSQRHMDQSFELLKEPHHQTKFPSEQSLLPQGRTQPVQQVSLNGREQLLSPSPCNQSHVVLGSTSRRYQMPSSSQSGFKTGRTLTTPPPCLVTQSASDVMEVRPEHSVLSPKPLALPHNEAVIRRGNSLHSHSEAVSGRGNSSNIFHPKIPRRNPLILPHSEFEDEQFLRPSVHFPYKKSYPGPHRHKNEALETRPQIVSTSAVSLQRDEDVIAFLKSPVPLNLPQQPLLLGPTFGHLGSKHFGTSEGSNQDNFMTPWENKLKLIQQVKDCSNSGEAPNIRNISTNTNASVAVRNVDRQAVEKSNFLTSDPLRKLSLNRKKKGLILSNQDNGGSSNVENVPNDKGYTSFDTQQKYVDFSLEQCKRAQNDDSQFCEILEVVKMNNVGILQKTDVTDTSREKSLKILDEIPVNEEPADSETTSWKMGSGRSFSKTRSFELLDEVELTDFEETRLKTGSASLSPRKRSLHAEISKNDEYTASPAKRPKVSTPGSPIRKRRAKSLSGTENPSNGDSADTEIKNLNTKAAKSSSRNRISKFLQAKKALRDNSESPLKDIPLVASGDNILQRNSGKQSAWPRIKDRAVEQSSQPGSSSDNVPAKKRVKGKRGRSPEDGKDEVRFFRCKNCMYCCLERADISVHLQTRHSVIQGSKRFYQGFAKETAHMNKEELRGISETPVNMILRKKLEEKRAYKNVSKNLTVLKRYGQINQDSDFKIVVYYRCHICTYVYLLPSLISSHIECSHPSITVKSRTFYSMCQRRYALIKKRELEGASDETIIEKIKAVRYHKIKKLKGETDTVKNATLGEERNMYSKRTNKKPAMAPTTAYKQHKTTFKSKCAKSDSQVTNRGNPKEWKKKTDKTNSSLGPKMKMHHSTTFPLKPSAGAMQEVPYFLCLKCSSCSLSRDDLLFHFSTVHPYIEPDSKLFHHSYTRNTTWMEKSELAEASPTMIIEKIQNRRKGERSKMASKQGVVQSNTHIGTKEVQDKIKYKRNSSGRAIRKGKVINGSKKLSRTKVKKGSLDKELSKKDKKKLHTETSGDQSSSREVIASEEKELTISDIQESLKVLSSVEEKALLHGARPNISEMDQSNLGQVNHTVNLNGKSLNKDATLFSVGKGQRSSSDLWKGQRSLQRSGLRELTNGQPVYTNRHHIGGFWNTIVSE